MTQTRNKAREEAALTQPDETLVLSVSNRMINPVYRPYLYREERYLVFYGGAGSGKSFFVCQRYLMKLLEQSGRNLLVVRRVERANRSSTFPLFQQVIRQWGLSAYLKIFKDEMRILCLLNNNEILFRGLADVERLKSITFSGGILTDIWIEEASEVTRAQFNQLDVRLRGRGKGKQIVLSFNPVSANHWLKERFFDAPPKNAATLHTTYLQNRFIDDDYKSVLEGYRFSDPYYYQVYCLGCWGVYGKTVFNPVEVSRQIAARKKVPPEAEGFFNCRMEKNRIESFQWTEEQGGYIRIFHPPQKGVEYVLGADTAGDGSDYFVGQVLEVETGRQAAILRHRMDEELFARQIYCLGRYYGNALVGIETNFSTYPVKELQRLGYPRQLVRRREDHYSRKPVEAYGFRTTAASRPVALASLTALVRENIELIEDVDTLEEMLSFVRNEKGRAEAQQGSHDDCVMALAIAAYMRSDLWEPQVLELEEKLERGKGRWTEDMWEDYRNAEEGEREYLRQKWGSPPA